MGGIWVLWKSIAGHIWSTSKDKISANLQYSVFQAQVYHLPYSNPSKCYCQSISGVYQSITRQEQHHWSVKFGGTQANGTQANSHGTNSSHNVWCIQSSTSTSGNLWHNFPDNKESINGSGPGATTKGAHMTGYTISKSWGGHWSCMTNNSCCIVKEKECFATKFDCWVSISSLQYLRL